MNRRQRAEGIRSRSKNPDSITRWISSNQDEYLSNRTIFCLQKQPFCVGHSSVVIARVVCKRAIHSVFEILCKRPVNVS